MALKRINRELLQCQNSPSHGVALTCPDPNDKFNLKAWISGHQDSVYEGGMFELNIKIPPDYPFKVPQIVFTTKVYHPNINSQGKISMCQIYCNSCGSNSWSPALTLQRLLMQIRGILIEPSPDDPLVPQIGRQYKQNRAQFDRIAKEWTQKYAMQV